MLLCISYHCYSEQMWAIKKKKKKLPSYYDKVTIERRFSTKNKDKLSLGDKLLINKERDKHT